MRNRRNSSVKLDLYARVVFKTILQHQDLNTGLVSDSENGHAWIRDNVYSILSVWALSLAYKKYRDYDEDRAKAYELERACIKCMRGLLTAMTKQKDKIELFKEDPTNINSLHAKFGCKTGLAVVGDTEWGHLQIDAVSLYLLVLAEMTASGLQIIFTLDEVAVVQNLVFYIESAYCIPDYGIWERGDKSNTGILELNSTSIGMAIAALESLDELDLFGIRGGPSSVIHVMSDEIQKCRAVLQSMLPRESMSKETDAALLTVIGYPAFAVTDQHTIDVTLQEIMTKLGGRYGCKRFLRDGYKNPKEDSSRLHYETWELRVFENIECQWPMFFCYCIINSYFMGAHDQADAYAKHLDTLLVHTSHGIRLLPELYAIPLDKVDAELASPGSQEFVATGRIPFMWAQSLYVISQLLKDAFIACGELDPINRRLSCLKRPEVIVQVVVLAKDDKIKDILQQQAGFATNTLKEVTNIQVHPARVLSHLYTFLGRSEKLGLTGRCSRDVGILTTSKLYKIQDRIFAFTPQRFDFSRNYMDCDPSLLVTTLEYGLNYLSRCWTTSGRPTITLVMGQNMLERGDKLPPAMVAALKKLKAGYINGTRVVTGQYEHFLKTTCVSNMSFLGSTEEGNPDLLQPEVQRYLSQQLGKSVSAVLSLLQGQGESVNLFESSAQGSTKRKASLKGSIRRSRSKAEVATSSENSRIGSRHSSGAFLRSRNQSGNSEDSAILDVFSMPEEDRNKILEQSSFSEYDVAQLVHMLINAPHIEEQADILHYLVFRYGPKYKLHVNQLDKDIEIEDLLFTLFETAMAKKNWTIVRQTAGFLGKAVEDLSKAVTDLLVRQKQVTVGMPPHDEVIISTGAAIKRRDLIYLIHKSYRGDESLTMLTQELLVYLSMFIQTEPELFHGMLRLRIGLIIHVMVSEMVRCLKISDEDDVATDELMSLSPYEMRNLLHHIMSGREFEVKPQKPSGYCIISENDRVSKNLHHSVKKQELGANDQAEEESSSSSDDSEESDRHGIWLRRRRLDGALNRVPRGFYAKVWMILENCRGISIRGRTLDTFLTQGMTSGEMKFALEVESVLNTVPEPEFRQLMVEALIILCEAVVNKIVRSEALEIIQVEEIVHAANKIFLQDQICFDGDATLCCAAAGEFAKSCGNAAGICRFFYDSAPSGQYGTMAYLVRGVCQVLDHIPDKGDIECLPM